jgi:hypothetical protein
MGQFLTHIYAVLLRPKNALENLSSRQFWWQAAFVLLFVSGLNTISYAKVMNLNSAEVFLALIVGWGLVFFTWVGASMLLSLMADLFGGKGRTTDTMTGLGFSLLPFIFLPITHAFPNILGSSGHAFKLLAFLALVFWSLVLVMISLKKSQNISLDRSIGSFIMSGVVLIAGVVGSMTFAALQFSLFLKQWG